MGERLVVVAFLGLFLLPMFARSTFHPPPLPGSTPMLAKLHAVACLFTQKPSSWSSYYVQVRYPGDPRWVELPEREYFGLQPFGRRTRLHRLFVAWRAKPSPKTKELATWLLERHAALHGDELQPEAIRFARAWTIPSRDAPPQQGWHAPDWIDVPPRSRRVFATYLADELVGGQP